ncbi:Uncharacterized protein PECH_000268 [Penicillium ucsense]|uniref:Uncharacterized protein n=1 Tax=Penicillium ucsense TaxID=2839758 RepID=A0A8J8W7D4_9EURO|nr:Uncharacterized protein PECM_008595 [Penicillium ucsense]KAF7738546.1 Uncharacterized protein PECH_000268 [Penicillium ucsense]
MHSQLVLRLTVEVASGDSWSASHRPSQAAVDGRGRGQDDSDVDGTRAMLIVVKDPENMSIQQLIVMIQDQWKDVWPLEGPLCVGRLINKAFPRARFSLRCTVADVWLDRGRAALEGFDQRGTVTVIPETTVPSVLLRRRQRATPPLVEVVEGNPRPAKRKLIEEISTDAMEGITKDDQAQPRTPQQGAKRRRLSGSTGGGSSSKSCETQVFSTKTITPCCYGPMRVPSFACPSGHRRNTNTVSGGSSTRGLGLGITSSPGYRRQLQSLRASTGEGLGTQFLPPPPRPRLSSPFRFHEVMPSQPSDDAPSFGQRQLQARLTTSPAPERALAQDHDAEPPRQEISDDEMTFPPKPASKTSTSTSSFKWSSLLPELRDIERQQKATFTKQARVTLNEMLQISKELTKIEGETGRDPAQRKRLLSALRKRLDRRRDKVRKMKAEGSLLVPEIPNLEDSSTENGDLQPPRNNEPMKAGLFPKGSAKIKIPPSPAGRSTTTASHHGSDCKDEPKDVTPESTGVMVCIKGDCTDVTSTATKDDPREAQSTGSSTIADRLPESFPSGEEILTESEGGDIAHNAKVTKAKRPSPSLEIRITREKSLKSDASFHKLTRSTRSSSKLSTGDCFSRQLNGHVNKPYLRSAAAARGAKSEKAALPTLLRASESPKKGSEKADKSEER